MFALIAGSVASNSPAAPALGPFVAGAIIWPKMPADERPLEVRCERRSGDTVVVVACGDLDIASADLLRETFNGETARAPAVVLDLRAIRFIDSSGLAAVLEQQHNAGRVGGAFAVAVGGSGSQVRRLLALTGLSETLTLLEDPDDLESPRRSRTRAR